MEMAELTVKLCGILWRKAEMDNDYTNIYYRMIEKMMENEFENFETDILEVLGGVGG